jgi:hypothetical protein
MSFVFGFGFVSLSVGSHATLTLLPDHKLTTQSSTTPTRVRDATRNCTRVSKSHRSHGGHGRRPVLRVCRAARRLAKLQLNHELNEKRDPPPWKLRYQCASTCAQSSEYYGNSSTHRYHRPHPPPPGRLELAVHDMVHDIPVGSSRRAAANVPALSNKRAASPDHPEARASALLGSELRGESGKRSRDHHEVCAIRSTT